MLKRRSLFAGAAALPALAVAPLQGVAAKVYRRPVGAPFRTHIPPFTSGDFVHIRWPSPVASFDRLVVGSGTLKGGIWKIGRATDREADAAAVELDDRAFGLES